MICTTLNKIREHDPCADGWQKLLAGLNKTEPDDEPLPLVRDSGHQRTERCSVGIAHDRLRPRVETAGRGVCPAGSAFDDRCAKRGGFGRCRTVCKWESNSQRVDRNRILMRWLLCGMRGRLLRMMRGGRLRLLLRGILWMLLRGMLRAAETAARAAADDATWCCCGCCCAVLLRGLLRGCAGAAMREKQVELFKEILG